MLTLTLYGCVAKQRSQADQPTLLDAMVRLQAQDASSAVKILNDVTAREPHNGRAWGALGVAELQLKNLDDSQNAFRRELVEDPGYPAPLFQLAVIAALRHNQDEA